MFPLALLQFLFEGPAAGPKGWQTLQPTSHCRHKCSKLWFSSVSPSSSLLSHNKDCIIILGKNKQTEGQLVDIMFVTIWVTMLSFTHHCSSEDWTQYTSTCVASWPRTPFFLPMTAWWDYLKKQAERYVSTLIFPKALVDISFVPS